VEYPPSPVVDREPHIEQTESNGWDDEEVHSRDQSRESANQNARSIGDSRGLGRFWI
jgi:hypothetical protein